MKKSVKTSILRIIMILFLLLLFLFGFTYGRLFILLFFLGLAVADLVRKKIWLFADIIIVVTLHFFLTPGRGPAVYDDLERVRFMLLQNQYEKATENIINAHPDDMEYQRIEDCCKWFLGGDIDYRKEEESVVIFFITEYVDVSGYVYYSDEAAKDFMKDCERIEPIKDHWMWVQIY